MSLPQAAFEALEALAVEPLLRRKHYYVKASELRKPDAKRFTRTAIGHLKRRRFLVGFRNWGRDGVQLGAEHGRSAIAEHLASEAERLTSELLV